MMNNATYTQTRVHNTVEVRNPAMTAVVVDGQLVINLYYAPLLHYI